VRPLLIRHRRLVAAALAALATALGLLATRPHTTGVRVLVAARDLSAGTTLAPSDVTGRVYPARAVPAGAVRRAAGRTLSGPVRRGEPLTDVRLRAGGPLTDQPGTVAVPIRLADAAVAVLLHPGDRVDVLAARSEDPGPARVVAAAVPVVAVPRPGPEATEGAIIVVRTVREQSTALARAATDSRLSISIVG
jgi:Flp pilus assembly protein CpaB